MNLQCIYIYIYIYIYIIIYEIKYKTNVVTQSFMPEFTDNLRTTKVLLTKFDRLSIYIYLYTTRMPFNLIRMIAAGHRFKSAQRPIGNDNCAASSLPATADSCFALFGARQRSVADSELFIRKVFIQPTMR